MRKVLSVLAAVAAAAAGLVALSAAPASAATVYVDLQAATSSNPAAVSPAGADVLYTATYTNNGPIDVTADLTNATTNGTFVSAKGPAGCTTPDHAANPTLACTLALPTGGSVTIQVVIKSPSTTGTSVGNTATIAVNPAVVGVLDLNGGNNSATVSTPVNGPTSGASAGFVPQGGTLTWRKHVMTVTQANYGVIASLSDTTAPSTFSCGGVTTPCASGLHADFDQDPAFFGNLSFDLDFGTGDPCHGLGATQCHPLYFHKPTMTATGTQVVPLCSSPTTPGPCITSVYKSSAAEFHWVVRMDTNDPDLLSTARSLSVNG